MTLGGRVALVTGASRGIGRAGALALARAGADVAVNYKSQHAAAEEVAGLARRLGRRAITVAADLGDAAAIAPLVDRVAGELGPVDILVCNAGEAEPAHTSAIDRSLWDRTLAVNLTSAFLLAQAVVPSMRQRGFGRLIFISSVAAHVGGVVGPHYAASKAGLIGLMHGYASRLAKDGVTANAIAPALIGTDMVRSNPAAHPDIIPLGRFGTPEEVAEAIVLVAANGYITGQTLNIDGGLYPT